MLAGAGIDGQYEHEPGWAPGPVGRRGGCDRELHADPVRRVDACQPAVSRATLTYVPWRVSRRKCCRKNSATSGPSYTTRTLTLMLLPPPLPSGNFGAVEP